MPKIERPSLEVVQNGFKIRYEEYDDMSSSKGDDPYGHRQYLGSKEEVFLEKQEKEAMTRFKELSKQAGLLSSEEHTMTEKDMG